ncbi:T9SS type A sorting domain-containing protein [Candidatus Amoebophilus asiaticus]|nr:T9SS type A sorting domain-containing protein [Candidatus Amoebophilus asiaticus]
MKRIFILIFILTFANLSYGQIPFLSKAKNKNVTKQGANLITQNNQVFSKTNKYQPQFRNSNMPGIMSEDFSGGLPSGWTNSGTPAAALWEYRGTATTPDNTTGGRGGCSNGAPLQSPTTANGFFIFDSNYLDDPSGVCGGAMGTGAAPPPHTGILQTGTINCSANASVSLTFSQYIRTYDSQQKVNISISGGAWTNVWSAGLAQGANTTNPDNVTIDLTSWAANQADVRLQFEFDGTQGALQGYYEWMIDDIEVYEPNQYDASHFGISNGLSATMIPLSQANNIDFSGNVSNVGSGTLTNVTFSADVENPSSTNVFSGSGSIASFLSGAADTVITTSTGLSASVVGVHTVYGSVSVAETEGDYTNNNDTTTITIHDSIYAKEDGNATGSLGIGPGNDGVLGHSIIVTATDTLTSVTFWLNAPTLGDTVSVEIYDFAAGLPNAVLAGTNEYYVTAADTGGAYVTLMVNGSTGVILTAGTYLLGVNESVTNNITLGTTTNYFFPGEAWVKFPKATGAWGNAEAYGFLITYILRANFGGITSASPCAGFSVSSTTTDATCGNADGSASASVIGGTASFTYQWSTGATTFSISGLAVGTYTVSVTDGNGCIVGATATVSNTGSVPVVTVNVTDATCGNSNGAASANVTGGTPNYLYLWSNGVNTSSIFGVLPGTYTVSVTDANGCMTGETVTISNVGSPPSVSANGINPTCPGGSDGSATAVPTGGNPPYTYAWDDANNQTTVTASNLPAGNYNVVVTDADGCDNNAGVTLNDPTAMALLMNSTDASCGATDGTADVTPSGGTPSYTFAWSNGATTQTISGIGAGIYTVTVADANGCEASNSVGVNNTGAPIVVVSSTNVSCNGGSDGTASVSVISGAGPFNYSWSNGATTSSISGLTANSYVVSVEDSSGCIQTATVLLSEPTVLGLSMSSTPESCTGNDGTASVIVGGGTGPYTYSWSNGGTASSITGVTVGNYTVQVTDANGCLETDNVDVVNSSGLSVNLSKTNVSCSGGSDGSVSTAVSGGSAPYTYAWSTGSTADNISGLSTGSYTVTVYDANGCKDINSATLSTSSTLMSLIINTTDDSGFGDGSASVTITGGTPTYSYSWSTGATTSSISNLSAGTYTVVVTDANGCTADGTANIVLSALKEIGSPSLAVNIYPNPTSGSITVSILSVKRNDELQISVFNLLGKEISYEILPSQKEGTYYLDLTQQVRGVYFLKLRVNDQFVVRKIVLNK